MKRLKEVGLATLALVGAAYAGGESNDLASMKTAMNEMRAEIAALRDERAMLRSNAGGVPEGLRTANGEATIRIGGDFRMQYAMGWSNGYGRTGIDGVTPVETRTPNANFKSSAAGWAVSRAQLFFDIDLSCDTSAKIDLRLNGDGAFGQGGNILNEAFWDWRNIGGSNFNLRVGLAGAPFGMWSNTDMGGYGWDTIDRALITKPFVMDSGQISSLVSVGGFYGATNRFTNATSDNFTRLGVYATYTWEEQVTIKGGIMAGGELIGRNTAANDLGLTYNNDLRNLGFVDHVITVGYNPCWLEGLHLEAGYLGRFDQGLGQDNFTTGGGNWNNANPFDNRDLARAEPKGDTAYIPTFNFGAVYKINDALKIFAEAVMTANTWYRDGFSCALSAGFDYALTEKIMLGMGYDYYHVGLTSDWYTTNPDHGRLDSPTGYYVNVHRLSVGGKYDFGNGLYFQAQYYHDFMSATGINDGAMKSADVVLLQTGYVF